MCLNHGTAPSRTGRRTSSASGSATRTASRGCRTRRRRRAAAAADAARQRRRRGRPRAPDARPDRGGRRVARPRRRALPRELRRCAAGQLGPADRRDQGARARRRLGRRGGGCALGARGRRREQREPDRPATPRRWRCSCSATTRKHACTPTRSASRDDFPADVGDALAFLAAQDVVGYTEAVEVVLESFETRDEYLEDMPVADTVLVLQALAAAPRPRARTSARRFCPSPRAQVDRRRRVEHRRDHDRLDVGSSASRARSASSCDQLQRLLGRRCGR